MRTRRLLLLTLVLALTGCEGNPDPEQACEDTADALAKAAVRCNLGKYPEVFGAVVSGVGDCECAACEQVVAVRDIDALYDDCFPTLQKLSCPEIEKLFSLPQIPEETPASCREQLLVSGP